MASKTCPQCGTQYRPEELFCSRDGTVLQPSERGSGFVGRIIADRYQVIEKLGEGGMGRVYLAEHIRIKRKNAVKVIRPAISADPEMLGRFQREALNASQVEHPNVAAIYDFGETDDGLVYLAMEYIAGESLAAILAREGSLPVARVAGIVRQIAEGLSAAHEAGIVHRDLKPENVMVGRTRDGGDRVKIVDFGIAKIPDETDQKLTASGAVIGTPAYMSPEQLRGTAVDSRTDIHALGLLTFKMLAGVLPFGGTTTNEHIAARLTQTPSTLARARPDVAWVPEIEASLARVLAMDPAMRPQTATAFAAELENAALVQSSIGAGEERAITERELTTLPFTAAAPPPTVVRPDKTTAMRRAAIGVVVAAAGVAGWIGVAKWSRPTALTTAPPVTLPPTRDSATLPPPSSPAQRALTESSPPQRPVVAPPKSVLLDRRTRVDSTKTAGQPPRDTMPARVDTALVKSAGIPSAPLASPATAAPAPTPADDVRKVAGLDIRMPPCHRATGAVACEIRIFNTTGDAVRRMRLDEMQATTQNGTVVHASSFNYDPGEAGMSGRDGRCPSREECRVEFRFDGPDAVTIARVEFVVSTWPFGLGGLTMRYRHLGKAAFEHVVIE